MNEINFSNKVVVVTGAAEGIGEAIVTKFHDLDANVVITDIQIEKGTNLAAKLGDRAVFIPCDVSDYNSVTKMFSNVIEHFGQLDIVINNAGINTYKKDERVPFYDYSKEIWQGILAVNLTGTFYCCSISAAAMIKLNRGGVIVNIASVAGMVALRLQIGFVASKAAIIRMSETMAIELAGTGIRVNTVSPGSIITQATKNLFYTNESHFKDEVKRLLSFIPQGRPGHAEEVASAVVFLSSERASYINGHNLVVDGGWTSGFVRDF